MNNQVCKSCVLDDTVPEISFDSLGVCNYCSDFESNKDHYIINEADGKKNLKELFEKIKKSRNSDGYDSLIGLSGGVDSSYVALLAKEYGLKPLCVHFDNGWNSELAVSNIQGIIQNTKFDLQTYVIDWNEFRDLQRSFLLAGVVDLELLSDHAIFASMYKLRRKYNIKYIISGTNYLTEHGMPMEWIWHKTDLKNIKSIHKIFGSTKLKSYPTITSIKWVLSRKFGFGGEFVEPLNLFHYKKQEAIDKLQASFGWRSYGEKHQESIITRFYQGYILPVKFGIDKRKVHYSALIRNHEMSKEQALLLLEQPAYPAELIKDDKEYVQKKLGFTESEFTKIMETKGVPHDAYGTDRVYIKFLSKVFKKFLNKKI